MLGLDKTKEFKTLKITSYQDSNVDKEYILDKKKILVGRFEQADISIDSDHISYYHAFIILDDQGGGKIIDLESDNGFLLNGEKQTICYFSAGDIIKFGDVEFHVGEIISENAIKDLDEGAIIKVKHSDEKEICELPPVENMVIIDGEYCDINFNESDFRPINPIRDLENIADFSDYVDTSKPVEFLPILKELNSKSIEVSVISNGSVISLDYLPIKNKTYYISNNINNDSTIQVDCLNVEGKIPLLKIKKETIRLFKINDFTSVNLQKNEFDPFAKEESIELQENDVISFNHKTVQVIIKMIDSPPIIRSTPFFGRDREFKIHLSKYVTIIMSLAMLLLFIDLSDLKKPIEKKIAIIYKRAQKPVDKKMPKAFEEKEDTGTKQVETPKEQMAKKIISKPKAKKVEKTKKPPKKMAKTPVKKPIKAYKFKMKKSLAALFSNNTSKSVKINTKSVKRSMTANTQTSNDALLHSKSNVKIGKMGDDFKGKYDRSYGTKGFASKDGFDTTYVEPKTVVLGSMDPELLRKILKEYLPQFKFCYQEELMERNEAIKGVVDLQFTIGRNGRVTKATVKSKQAKFSRSGVKCMTKVLKLIPFPKPKGGGVVEVRQPLNFSSERVSN